MEKFVKELFTEEILMKVAALYGLKKEQLYSVGGFENYVYAFDTQGRSYIVRISHSSHRTFGQVQAEVDFLLYLASNRANVCTPITTVNNKLVEKIDCGDSYFIVCAFTKAEGERPSRDNVTDAMFVNYGRTIGQFHVMTKNYKEKGEKHRYNWDEDLLIKKAELYLPEQDKIIIQRLNEIIAQINKIEKTKDNFGLIHGDIHIGNFFVKDDNLTVFDFDDISYHYFASDIAIALFYLVYLAKEEEQLPLADRLMKNLMKGYLEVNSLSKEDYMTIPLFLKLREIIVYTVLHRTVDVEKSDYAKKFISRYRDRIINKTPFIDLDFAKYYLEM